MERKDHINALVALKGAEFTDDHKKGIDLLPDAMIANLHTLAGKTPADAIVQAKFAADSALAGHAHSLNAKEAADKKKEEDAAAEKARVASQNNPEDVKLKAAAAKMTVEEYEEAEYLKTAPQSVRTLVANEKARNATRKTELVNVLKTAGALTEDQLKAKSLEDLETLAKFAKVDEVDFSGRGLAGGEKDVFANPPNGYAIALEARNKAH